LKEGSCSSGCRKDLPTRGGACVMAGCQIGDSGRAFRNIPEHPVPQKSRIGGSSGERSALQGGLRRIDVQAAKGSSALALNGEAGGSVNRDERLKIGRERSHCR